MHPQTLLRAKEANPDLALSVNLFKTNSVSRVVTQTGPGLGSKNKKTLDQSDERMSHSLFFITSQMIYVDSVSTGSSGNFGSLTKSVVNAIFARLKNEIWSAVKCPLDFGL